MFYTRLKMSLMACIVFCAFSTLFAYSGGSGTTEDPYQVGTVADWNELMNTQTDWDANFIMIADINLQGESLIPIAFFEGIFEGNGHVVRNAEINMPGYWHIGLFGITDHNSQLRNLGVEDVNMIGEGDVAGLVGANKGTIINCFATGKIGLDTKVPSNGANLGGLVGLNRGTISGSHSCCDINGLALRLGGLVGSNYKTITDSYANGTVNGDRYVGGLAGLNGYLEDEYGVPNPDYIGTIARCYASGLVSGNSYVGGLAGDHGYDVMGYMAGVSITDCYSNCEVTGGAGLIGHNYGHTANCYAAGKVNGSGGGLVSSPVPTLINCFWDIEATGQTTSGSGTGKTTAEMKTLSTFTSAGWDFVDTWGIGENQTYPFLRTYSGSDLNYDGLVDFIDFAVWANHWLEGI